MIKLFKDKIVYENEYKIGTEAYIKKEIDDLILFLNEPIELSEDFTLEDFFKIIEKDIDSYERVFYSFTKGISIKSLIADIHKLTDFKEKTKDNLDIDFLECIWGAELDYWKDGKEFEIWADFGGWGDWDDTENDIRGKGGIAVEFTPLSELKDLVIKLNEEFNLCDGKTFETIVKGKRIFTIYNVFGVILFELTFAGEPEERDKVWKDTLEIVDEAKERIKKEGINTFPELKKEKID